MLTNAQRLAQNVAPREYHAQTARRGEPAFAMSPSQLKEFGKCPARWINGYNPPGSDAKAWGSLLDACLLTPEHVSEHYAVKPATYQDSKTGEPKPWNANAKFCRDWANWQGGREIISAGELNRADEAVAAMLKDEVSKAFLDASDRQVLVTGQWHDEETGLIVPVRCLLDLVPRPDTEFYKCAGDLKTTRNAALIPFQRQVYQYGWHVQAAFDLDLLVAATGEDRCEWVFLVQESFAPWQSAKRLLSVDFIEMGRVEYRRLLKLYCRCLAAGIWPDYDAHDEAIQGGWSLVAPEPWMGSELMFAPRLELPEESPAPQPDDGELVP